MDFCYLMLLFAPDDNAIILNIIFGIKSSNAFNVIEHFNCDYL
jgi:hypothetical protein